jgi:hypothetical protein
VVSEFFQTFEVFDAAGADDKIGVIGVQQIEDAADVKQA